jgi:hypothetical protein
LIFLDVIQVLPDEQAAKQLGRKHKQEAIYDLATGKEIRIDYGSEAEPKRQASSEARVQAGNEPGRYGQAGSRTSQGGGPHGLSAQKEREVGKAIQKLSAEYKPIKHPASTDAERANPRQIQTHTLYVNRAVKAVGTKRTTRIAVDLPHQSWGTSRHLNRRATSRLYESAFEQASHRLLQPRSPQRWCYLRIQKGYALTFLAPNNLE